MTDLEHFLKWKDIPTWYTIYTQHRVSPEEAKHLASLMTKKLLLRDDLKTTCISMEPYHFSILSEWKRRIYQRVKKRFRSSRKHRDRPHQTFLRSDIAAATRPTSPMLEFLCSQSPSKYPPLSPGERHVVCEFLTEEMVCEFDKNRYRDEISVFNRQCRRNMYSWRRRVLARQYTAKYKNKQ